MESLTKNKQSEKNLFQMTEKIFTPHKMEGYKELTEGYFNMAYEIRLSNGEKVILKVAPPKETRVMTYEKNIMFSEVEAMKLAARHGGIPVPEVIAYDDSCTVCNSPYFFMEKLKGQSLYSIKDTLTPEQADHIYVETGKINRKINDIRVPLFGYPGQPGFQGKVWYPVFRKMVQAALHDALLGNVDLKIPAGHVMLCLDKDKAIFSEVTEPRLVHWDCWDGNIFVHSGEISGLIDWERSIWGDPLMEVGFRTFSDHTCFQKGYGIGPLTGNQIRRALWYDIYLMLLAALECEYRKYDTLDIYNYSTTILAEQFNKIRVK